MNGIERMSPSGVQLKRGLLVVAVVSMVVLSAGCSGFLSDPANGSEKTSQVEKAPADTEMLVTVDQTLFMDAETLTLMEGTSGTPTESIQEMEDLYTEFKNETGLDPADLNRITMFGTSSGDLAAEGEYGILIDADWDTEATVDAIGESEGVDFERTEYAGEDVLWEPANPDQYDEPVYVGLHDDGQFVVGTKAAVTASLDVSYNGADPVSGTLLDAYESSPDGLVSFAMDASTLGNQSSTGQYGQFVTLDGLQTITGAYSTPDGNVTLETRLAFDEEEQATNLEGTINLFVDQYESALDPEQQALIAGLETETDGSTLVITWEAEVDTLVEAANGGTAA